MKIRLTQLDGKLPNLALMKLAHWHKAQGDDVHYTRFPTPTLWEGPYDRVYASTIFEWTRPVVERFMLAYPDAIVGGTGTPENEWGLTVENVIGQQVYEHYDYDVLRPSFRFSIGFTQRGCRLRCPFCVVPKKEGKPVMLNSIPSLWRGDPHPRAILLLDNDFFGVPQWRDRIEEIRDGKFRVSFSQGINIRMVTAESAAALASIEYRDDDFQRRRLYTAWDNLKDETRFFDGLSLLEAAGVPAKHVMVFMLVGYRAGETMDEVMYRFQRMKVAGVMPYPMVYEKWRAEARELRHFQRWVIGRFHQFRTWEQYKEKHMREESDAARA